MTNFIPTWDITIGQSDRVGVKISHDILNFVLIQLYDILRSLKARTFAYIVLLILFKLVLWLDDLVYFTDVVNVN